MRQAILSLFFLFALLTSLPYQIGIVYAQGVGGTAGSAGSLGSVGTSACGFIQGAEKGTCQSCFDGGGAWTGIGCLGGDSPTAFIASFIKIATGIGGGIAFLLILFSGFQTMMSAGNPEKLHAAKELMTAAISGLLLIIFSVFLLKLIGVDILAIPGWS